MSARCYIKYKCSGTARISIRAQIEPRFCHNLHKFRDETENWFAIRHTSVQWQMYESNLDPCNTYINCHKTNKKKTKNRSKKTKHGEFDWRRTVFVYKLSKTSKPISVNWQRSFNHFQLQTNEPKQKIHQPCSNS